MYPPLNALDRCDALNCSAAALVRFYQANRDLVFCGHHSNRYETQLKAEHWLIWQDRRPELRDENRLKGSEN